ncbi:uncharacterized protein LOC131674238 [Phymastichus coffea]|uniref:uncharacterized protein LOC131674238 n=1 Tax=Phymastichus coffea TaxID=108790 RepID=UPI00273CC784|nr:uncharacterized protein LOC131674238 [Phymastichus coffea]
MSTNLSKKNNMKLFSHYQYQQLIVDGNKYLIGACKTDEFLHILLTDLTDFYEEKLSKEDSMKRIEELNPLLLDCDIDEILDDLLVNIPKYTTSCSLQYIELENQIEGGCFWFRVNLTKVNPQPFLDQYTENFYTCLSELYHRYNCLLDLVKKKDKEIDEYKTQGVKINKRSLVTDPFNEKFFETKLKNVETKQKMDIFLETMIFLNSIKKSNLNDPSQKNKSVHIESEVTVGVSNQPFTNKEIAVKRPPSSDMRCAVIPRIAKKAKQSKQNSFLQHI